MVWFSEEKSNPPPTCERRSNPFLSLSLSLSHPGEKKKGGSTRKRIFPPLPKIQLCAHPEME
jgi:hypothetical protein